MFQRPIFFNEQWRSFPWLIGLLGILFALAAGWLIGTLGMLGAIATVGLPVALIAVISILLEPKIGLLTYITLSFIIGFTRFIPGETPLGLSLDGVLILTVLSVFLNGKRMNWKRLKSPVFYLLTAWLFYTILQYFNPEVPNHEAWFYKIRSFSLNWFFLVLITLVLPITRSEIWWLVKLWLFWSFVGTLWAFKQQYIGIAEAEARWLAEGAAKTHVLWGQLRCFSFYSDASQYGGEMAGVTLVCLVLMAAEKSGLRRMVYLVLTLVLFWGYALSGTRSALFVLIAGYPAYLFLRRNVAVMIRGAAIAAPLMAILLFTHIGDSVYQIYRIRTALHPTEDASFMVRMENQKLLKNYMKDLPFGAGLGTSGAMGARFSPNHGAAQIPPDSWYVELWIETGVVGVAIYLLMLAGIIGIGIIKIWQLKDPWLITIMIALLAEFIGISVMSYSNPTLGQFPTSTILAITSVLFTTCKRWDVSTEEASAKADTRLSRFTRNYGTV